MGHFIFHTGPDWGRPDPVTCVALTEDLGRIERSGKRLRAVFEDLLEGLGDLEWSAFAPTVQALELDPARRAEPTEAQAIELVDCALKVLPTGEAWQLRSKVKQYEVLRLFAELAGSSYFSRPGYGYPYHCRFEGSYSGVCYVFASSTENRLSVMVLLSEDDLRRALNLAMEGQDLRSLDHLALVLENHTPWWLSCTEALFGVAFYPLVLNMQGGTLYSFEDESGLALGVLARALAAAGTGEDAEAHVSVEGFDVRCTLTRIDL